MAPVVMLSTEDVLKFIINMQSKEFRELAMKATLPDAFHVVYSSDNREIPAH